MGKSSIDCPYKQSEDVNESYGPFLALSSSSERLLPLLVVH